MNLRLSIGFAALIALSLVSCYPVNENPRQTRGANRQSKPQLTAEQQKAKEQEELKKTEELKKKEQEELKKTETAKPESNIEKTEPAKKEQEPKKSSDYPVASKVPSKDGFVFSPYNNKVIDVRGIASGTVVSDPTYPLAEKKFFHVP